MTPPRTTPLTEEAFTEAVLAAVRAVPGVTATPLRPLALRLELDGRPATLDLASAYARAQREPAATARIIAHAAQALPEATHTERLVPERVLLVPRTLPDLARITRGRGDAARPVTRPLLGELVAALVHDNRHSVRVLTQLDADRLGLDDDALWALARRNLARVPVQLHGDDDLVQVVAGGTYDAACLWHPQVCAALPSGAVARAPARGVLLVCPRPTPARLASLDAVTREVFETRQHRLTLGAFALRDGAFVATSA